MLDEFPNLYVLTVLAPLLTSVVVGLGRDKIGRAGAHVITIAGMMVSLLGAVLIAYKVFHDGVVVDADLYRWVSGGDLFPFQFSVGYLLDPLSSVLMIVVNFVSLLVHIYTIGYMAEDEGYQRFFSYISLFTFFMLMLVSANNCLQLFFGWEGVGLASYLLIGFWYTREPALQGSLKAFLVNRVSDFGFLLGIALLFVYAGSVDYSVIFAKAPALAQQNFQLLGFSPSVATVASLLLFVGAMGKSAQMPFHIWLPESMEGPTPISALIHAATMVTAGIFMISRMSPLFELSTTALSVILIVGASSALFMGVLALVMHDIKRVIAYSTLSQLGYMVAALGASAYSASIFHLVTHACFKALLFLGAGSVILGLHHEQDMRRMGGLWRYMPITYVTFLIGTLALVAIPPFSGFYSKDTIIELIEHSHMAGAHYAFFCVQVGALVTALYSFRALFMTFHGSYRGTLKHIYESPAVVTGPLVALAIPSLVLGAVLIQPMLFMQPSLLESSITVLPRHVALATLARHYHGALGMIIDSVFGLTFWLTLSGVVLAWCFYIKWPLWPAIFARRGAWLYRILLDKYGFDRFNDAVIVRGGRGLGQMLYNVGDTQLIDGVVVTGGSMMVYLTAQRARWLQSGYLFHYAAAMVVGLFTLLLWLMLANT
jgi:NADH-quinone oxidoreductase subunit L